MGRVSSNTRQILDAVATVRDHFADAVRQRLRLPAPARPDTDVDFILMILGYNAEVVATMGGVYDVDSARFDLDILESAAEKIKNELLSPRPRLEAKTLRAR